MTETTPAASPPVPDVAPARGFRVPYVVEVSVSSDHNFWSGFTHNLSEGGVFLATPREVPIGSVVQFELRLPNTGTPWLVRGEVRWTRGPDAAGPDSPPGIGVRFVDLDPALEREITEFITARESYFYDEE